MIRAVLKSPLYKSLKYFGFPRLIPFSLTVSVTRRCNSRCLTCNVWKDSPGEDLSAEEFTRIFESLGGSPFYMTFSGGEPFLRKDFAQICLDACRICRPGVVTIPTNGLLSGRIRGAMEEIVRGCSDARIILNLSLDGIGEKHDEIRGVKGGFQRVTETFKLLKSMNASNLQIGYHTVISKHNVHDIPGIFEYVSASGADSYVTEIAEERVELGTVGADIAPKGADYAAAANYLIAAGAKMDLKGFSRVIRALRRRYYRYVMDMLSGRDGKMRCYAGTASGQINANGDVWFCCMKAEPVGNLRDAGYDFRKVWFGSKAEELRKRMDREGCRCPMANMFYTNILMNPSRFFKGF